MLARRAHANDDRHRTTLLTGLGYGIDAAATRAARQHSGLVIGVNAGGVDVAYPRTHHHLTEHVASTGVLLSEAPPTGGPSRTRFVRRSRLLGVLSGAVVVVEATKRSGSMVLAEEAMRCFVPVGAVPGPVTTPQSEGPHDLLRRGAQLITGQADLLRLLDS